AFVRRRKKFRGLAAEPLIEFAARGEHGVAQLLEVEALPWKISEEPVLRICTRDGGRRGALLIHGGTHHQAVHRLYTPTRLGEFACQPVEQFRMARRLRSRAEIARRAHEPGPEMMLPDAVDHDARREGVIRSNNGLSEFEPSGAVLERATF